MQCMVERECSGVLDWAVSVQLVAGAGVRKPRLPVSAWVSVWGPGTVHRTADGDCQLAPG